MPQSTSSSLAQASFAGNFARRRIHRDYVPRLGIDTARSTYCKSESLWMHQPRFMLLAAPHGQTKELTPAVLMHISTRPTLSLIVAKSLFTSFSSLMSTLSANASKMAYSLRSLLAVCAVNSAFSSTRSAQISDVILLLARLRATARPIPLPGYQVQSKLKWLRDRFTYQLRKLMLHRPNPF